MAGKMLRIGLLKHVPAKWDVDANMEAFAYFAQAAARRGVQLFVTCECFLDGRRRL